MKRLRVLLVCSLIILSLAGCKSASRDESGVEVVVEGGDAFPAFLVGTWRANDESGWEFTFEPDGKVSSAIINLGMVKIIPGKVTRFPTRGGGKGVFKPDLWTVWYSPEKRELGVVAVIKDFYEDLGKNAIKGNVTDMLVGPISEDGKIWEADWSSMGTYIALIPEPKEIVTDKEPQFRKSLVFEKVESSKPSK